MLLAGLTLLMQTAVGPTPPALANSVRATWAADAPVLDGRDADEVWRAAPRIDDFLESRPSEGAEPEVRTEARVAYDARHLYVFVRAFDPHPDSIIGLLARRDDYTDSDRIIVMVDAYHDRRTGYEFSVNPVGVKQDVAIYDDGNEDDAWDAIWDVETTIDSLGWTAEFRIPLSQMRYSSNGDGTFGILIWRDIQRYTAVATWPLWRPSQPGFVSQFGDLTGLDDLDGGARIEAFPYLVAKSLETPVEGSYERNQTLEVGGDVKAPIASNLLLNATINPDFGQVEADPSELNLTAFETFFSERRPFFVEGRGLFSYPVNCVVVVDCNTGENLFYSRRIGRSPQLSGVYGDARSPTSTRILGAAKLTGRMPGGLSVGVLDAVTDDVEGPGSTTLEPLANYGVLRLNQDLRDGNTSFGVIATAVNRSTDETSAPYLHRSAYAAGVDARHRFAGHYEVSSAASFSRVAGDVRAIARTQLSSVHLYQRPDADLDFDSTRTSLSGSNVELRFAKVGGRRLSFETAYQRRTPGFDVNDVGFLSQADFQAWTTWAALAFRDPNRVFQQFRWNFNNWEYWTADGLPTDRAFNTNIHTQFNNRWWLHACGSIGQLGATYCDRCARGGPAIRQDPYLSPWMGIQGDSRKSVVPSLWINYSRTDGGRSRRINFNPYVEFKVSSRFNTSLSAFYDITRDDNQYYGTLDDAAGDPHYAFAHLERTTASLTWRLGYTFTPEMTLQIYASPFVSKGTYSDVRELDAPRAPAYDDRYRPYADPDVAADPGGFNFQQFRSNAVFRWEYRPGSTLFLVWSQGRQNSAAFEGNRNFFGDLDDLFNEHSDDTLLIKLSYWLAP